LNRWWKIVLILNICLVWALTGCADSGQPKTKGGKVRVVASLYPLEFFAREIGGTHVEVEGLVPPGVEPHDFELSARDMERIGEADVLVYNGAGLERWAEKVADVVRGEHAVVVDASEGISLLRAKGEEGDHEQGGTDPHIWLDPVLAKRQAANILDGLVKADPGHRADYEKNYSRLAGRLDELDRKFQDMVKKAPKKEFVVSHAAFTYLANRYGLEQLAVSGLSPSDEPGPQELQRIVERARNHQVRYILFETLVSGKVAQTVRKELVAEALVLNPLEGLTKEELARGADYFSIMDENRKNLAKALGVTP
jgi:zinc transport system substrate-binding protein